MVIMIIFLILSVLAILITFIYLKKSKNKVKQLSKRVDKNIHNDNRKKKQKKLRDILNLKINNSMINIENRYSCILRLGSIDYNMMSENEQEAVENVLMQTALSFDGFVQFLTTTENINTNEIINDINKTKSINMQIKSCKENLINFLNSIMQNKDTSINRNYIIISYDGLYEDAIKELNRRITNLRTSLSRVKIQCELLNDEYIYDLLYKELNKNSNIIKMNFGKEELYVDKKEKAKRRKQHI